MKTKNSTKKKLAAFALPALLLSFGFYGMILWTGCGVNSGSVLVLCGVVYGLAWSTGIGTLGEFSFSRTAVFATAGVVINCLAAMGE